VYSIIYFGFVDPSFSPFSRRHYIHYPEYKNYYKIFLIYFKKFTRSKFIILSTTFHLKIMQNRNANMLLSSKNSQIVDSDEDEDNSHDSDQDSNQDEKNSTESPKNNNYLVKKYTNTLELY